VKVTPLHPLFGAELTGADLAEPPSKALVEIVEKAMATYAVLVIRDQAHVGDEEHIRFSRAFGPLELPYATAKKGATRKRLRRALYDASNLDENGEIMAMSDRFTAMNKGNEIFHTDSSFQAMPTKWSLLFGHRVTSRDGQTEFSDTRAVYEALPEATKARIEGLTAEHNAWVSRRRGGFHGSFELWDLYPAVQHPLVRVSASGRKCLYIGAHADHIIGMDVEEGRALLAELQDFASQERFVISHSWRQGDLVIWDNRCTLHRARPYDYFSEKRDLRRTTVNEYGKEQSAPEAAAEAQA
jgi:alpha-ketoglutarate-dependent 2,4-dichlorophenoxyacetate dioxygenase